MNLAISLDIAPVQLEASAKHCVLPARRLPCALPESPLEEMIEMRYQQHLAQRALQELFENGALQSLQD